MRVYTEYMPSKLAVVMALEAMMPEARKARYGMPAMSPTK